MWDILSPKAIWEIKTKFADICGERDECLGCMFYEFCNPMYAVEVEEE